MLKRVISFLFSLLLLFSFFKSSIIIALIMILLLLLGKNKLHKPTNEVVCLSILIFTGICAGINNDEYLVLKDAYYFLFPVLFWILGTMLITIIPLKSMFKHIIICGALMSLIRIIISISFSGIEAVFNPYEARYTWGLIIATPVPVLALGILFYSNFFNYSLFSKRIYYLLFIVNSFGIYMFASRTYIVILSCFLLFIIFYKFRRKLMILITILFVAFIFFIQVSDFIVASFSDNTFMSKVFNSVSETTSDDYTTEEDINTKYRGYESFMALKSFKDSDVKSQIIGGFGKLVDLETYINLGSEEMRLIPVLHNGYLYLLIKSGILGLSIYLIIYYRILRRNFILLYSNKSQTIYIYLSGILLSTALGLLISNYVVSSFFSSEMCVLPILISYLDTHIKQHQFNSFS